MLRAYGIRPQGTKLGGEDPVVDEGMLLGKAQFADPVLRREGLALGGELPGGHGFDGTAGAGVLRARAGVVLPQSAIEIRGVTRIERAVRAA